MRVEMASEAKWWWMKCGKESWAEVGDESKENEVGDGRGRGRLDSAARQDEASRRAPNSTGRSFDWARSPLSARPSRRWRQQPLQRCDGSIGRGRPGSSLDARDGRTVGVRDSTWYLV